MILKGTSLQDPVVADLHGTCLLAHVSRVPCICMPHGMC